MPSPFTRKVTTSHRLRSPSNHRRDAMRHSRLPPPSPSNAQPPSISRALLFLIGFSTLTFTSAAYYSLRQTEGIACQLGSSRDVFSNISSYLTSSSSSSSSSSSTSSSGNVWGPGITDEKLSNAHAHDTATKLGVRMQSLLGWCEQLHFPAALTEFIGRTYIIVAEGYLELPPCKQAVVPIVAVNSIVFAAWSIASLRRGAGGRMYKWMSRHFVHRPCSNRLHTMVSSVYSHQAALHLVFNSIALWSISSSALILASTGYAYTNSRIPESCATPHFLAFFTSAGLFASSVSHIVAAIRFKRLSCLLSLPIAKTMMAREASLGASGAVYACLIMSACAFPQAQLGIIFLPFVTVPIGVGVAGLVAVDVLGVLRGWRVFDHWAHLGGAAFGGLYWYGDGVRAWEGLKKCLVERVGFGSGQRGRGFQYANEPS
ncbi:hypothetical protein NDA14_007929 [Ustilago hordei]|nr:hypothetical protein NDA14_007929 [Ustilago hordei]